MGHMEEAPAHLHYGQEGDQEAVGSLSLLMTIQEVGRSEVDILLHLVVVSCRTMKVEDRQEAAGMMAAAHRVPVVGF